MTKQALKKKVGERIIALRNQKGWSQADLARACNKDRQAIEKLENGKVNPTLYTLLEIANALEVSLPKLVDLVWIYFETRILPLYPKSWCYSSDWREEYLEKNIWIWGIFWIPREKIEKNLRVPLFPYLTNLVFLNAIRLQTKILILLISSLSTGLYVFDAAWRIAMLHCREVMERLYYMGTLLRNPIWCDDLSTPANYWCI